MSMSKYLNRADMEANSITPEKAQALLDADNGFVIALDDDNDAYLLPDGSPNNLLALPARDDDGSILNPVQWENMVARFNAAPDLARAYIAQAAEEARLRSKVEAAEKLAESGGAMIDFHNGPAEAKRPDIWQRLLQRFAAALSAYEEAGK